MYIPDIETFITSEFSDALVLFLSDGDCPMSFDGEPEINGK